MGKETKKTKYKAMANMDYSRASQILADFNMQDEKYMRDLVNKMTKNPHYSEKLDYKALRSEAFKIRAVLRKIVHGPILKNIEALAQATDFDEKERLEERVCIQLDGCNIPDNSYLIDLYKKAKSKLIKRA